METLKEIAGNDERKFYLVKEWVTEANLMARICQCVWSPEVKQIATSLTDHYTGYVKLKREDGSEIELTVEQAGDLEVPYGITFDPGVLPMDESNSLWVGFDSAHIGMEDTTLEQMVQYCEELAKQL